MHGTHATDPMTDTALDQLSVDTIRTLSIDAVQQARSGHPGTPMALLASYRAAHPGLASELEQMQRRDLPAGWDRNLPVFPAAATGVARGPSVLADPPGGNPEVILIASGSELSLAVEAHDELLAEGIRSRVVSIPSWEIFDHQTKAYRDSVLPPTVTARVAIEQASTFGWERYVGSSGQIIGMRTFGASAPLKALQEKFGFDPERVVAAARELLGSR